LNTEYIWTCNLIKAVSMIQSYMWCNNVRGLIVRLLLRRDEIHN